MQRSSTTRITQRLICRDAIRQYWSCSWNGKSTHNAQWIQLWWQTQTQWMCSLNAHAFIICLLCFYSAQCTLDSGQCSCLCTLLLYTRMKYDHKLLIAMAIANCEFRQICKCSIIEKSSIQIKYGGFSSAPWMINMVNMVANVNRGRNSTDACRLEFWLEQQKKKLSIRGHLPVVSFVWSKTQ